MTDFGFAKVIGLVDMLQQRSLFSLSECAMYFKAFYGLLKE